MAIIGEATALLDSAQGLTSNLAIPEVEIPKVDASMFTGTIQDITDQLIESATTLIGTITAPLEAVYSTIDTMYSTYDAAVSTANTLLTAATAIGDPMGVVMKFQKEVEKSETYKAKVESIKNSLDNVMVKVQEYIDEGKCIVSDAAHHSIQWIEDKINWVLEKIFGFVQEAVSKATAALNGLMDKAKKAAEAEAEKLKAKAEEKAKTMADQIAERQQKQKEKKAKNDQDIATA